MANNTIPEGYIGPGDLEPFIDFTGGTPSPTPDLEARIVTAVAVAVTLMLWAAMVACYIACRDRSRRAAWEESPEISQLRIDQAALRDKLTAEMKNEPGLR